MVARSQGRGRAWVRWMSGPIVLWIYSLCRSSQQLDHHQSSTHETESGAISIPLFCCTVTLSLAGNSTISIPNTLRSSICACSNTFLNCLPADPRTFSLTSALLIGRRWYSQARASRTSLLTICSALLSAWVPASPLYASGEAERRRR